MTAYISFTERYFSSENIDLPCRGVKCPENNVLSGKERGVGACYDLFEACSDLEEEHFDLVEAHCRNIM